MNRADHLARAKERALDYVARSTGEKMLGQAMSSFVGDLAKHEETAALAFPIGERLMPLVILGDTEAARSVINGVE
jgi:hypothetical protein